MARGSWRDAAPDASMGSSKERLRGALAWMPFQARAGCRILPPMRLALPLMLLLGGCAVPDASRGPAALVGAREDQLIGALGVPNRTYEIAGTTALGYDLGRLLGDPTRRGRASSRPAAPWCRPAS
jgi:hypothetical protein